MTQSARATASANTLRLTSLLLLTAVPLALAACGNNDDDGTNDQTTAPTVVSTSPANQANDVMRDVAVTITFSTPMDSGSVGSNLQFVGGTSQVSYTTSFSGSAMTLTPNPMLEAYTSYTVTIPTSVKSQGGTALASPYSFSFSTGGGFSGTLEPPTNVTATAGNESVSLTWTAAANADYYTIYMSNSSGVSPSNYTLTYTGSFAGGTATGLTNGITYYFVVASMSGDRESPPSPEVSATPVDSNVPSTPTLYVTALDAVNNLSWTQTYQEDYFRLEWATDAAFAGTVNVIDNLTGSEYSHTGRTNWTKLFYRIVAVNTAGDSAPSDVVSATPSPLITSLSAVTDARLQACLNSAIGWSVYAGQMTSLSCSYQPISTLAGLEQYRGLQTIFLSQTGITDLTPLASMVNLWGLSIDQNPGVTSLAPLANQTTLRSLDVSNDTGITDLSQLAALTNLVQLSARSVGLTNTSLATLPNLPALETLYLDGNDLTDLTSLADNTTLKDLNLNNNAGLVTLTPLASLTALTKLGLHGTAADESSGSIDAIANLTSLTELDLGATPIVTLPDLSGLTGLTYLNLNQATSLQDIGGLQGVTALRQLQMMSVSPTGGAFDNQNALGSLWNLTSLILDNNGLTSLLGLGSQGSLTFLSLGGNSFTDVSSLASLSSLETLSLYSNAITDVSGLAALTSLTGLNLADNAITNVAPLASLTALTSLDVSYNLVATGVASLVSLTSATLIDLRGNQTTMPCADLQTLITARGTSVVRPTSATSSANCTP